MGLFSNPLGHAGYPPNATGQATNVNSTVRAATATEAAAGVLTDCYLSPATADSATALDFASPPALGYGSTTPRPVAATTLTSSGASSLATGAGVALNLGNATGTVGFFGATAVAKPGSTDDLKDALVALGLYTTGGASPLDLDGGLATVGSCILEDTASVAGASPIVNNVRSGQASFTDVINTTAYGTLTITNSTITANSIIVATASCVTANSAVVVADIVPGAGTVAIRCYNAGSANTADNININFHVLN